MPTKQEFARQLRTKYPTQTARFQNDDQLVSEWVKTHPQDAKVIQENGNDDSSGVSIPALGLRVAPSVVGSAFGPIGGAIGSGLGETAAQIYEYLNNDQAFRPAQIGAQTAIGAIPFSKAKDASRLLQVAKQGLKGGVVGGTSTLLTNAADGELPSAKDMAIGVGGGAAFGAATQGTLSRRPKLIDQVGSDVRLPRVDEIEPAIPGTPLLRKQSPKEVKPGDMKFVDGGLRPEAPPQQAIPPREKFEFKSIQKFPEKLREGVQEIMDVNDGFEAQRRGVQPQARTKILAERLTVPMAQLRPGTALNAEELVAYRDALATVMSDAQDLAKKVATDPKAGDSDFVRLGSLIDKANTLTASYRGAKAEAGRALGMLRTKARILELGDASFQQQLMNAPGFRGNIQKIAQAMVAAGDDPVKQLTILRESSGTAYDKTTALYYNSLLSGVKTHLRNTIGNTFNMVSNLANPVIAGPLDKLRVAIKGGEREVFFGEASKAATATVAALPKAFSKMFFALKHGFDEDMLSGFSAGKLDTDNLVEAPGGALTNFPTRLLLATDNFFRTLAKDQELYGSAYAAARKGGAQTSEQIAEKMSAVLTDEQFMQRAELFAKKAVFQEDPGVVINTMLRWKNDPEVSMPIRSMLTFVAPFIRTPANILRQGLEASPIGFGMKATHQGGREGAQAIGKAATGSILLAPIAYLASTGQLSGSGPTDSAQRAALFEKGWQPNSVKIGDTWVRYQLFQPWSVPLAIVANAWDKFTESDQSDQAAETSAMEALAAAGASIIDQSFLSGVNGLLDAISDPKRFGAQFMSNSAQSMIPGSGLMRNVAQAVDPVVRKPETIKESIQSIIPGQSQKVPARLTRFGEEVKRPGGPIRRGFIVPETSKEINDPIAKRLEELGIELDVPRARIVRGGKQLPLTREQSSVIEKSIGKERRSSLERSMGANEYATRQNLSNATRNVNNRAFADLRTKKPISVERLAPSSRKYTKQELDRMYEEYKRRNGGNR